MDTDKGFESVDRRRVRDDDAAPETPQPMEADAPDAGEAEAEDVVVDHPPVDVYGLLTTTLSLLANGAWGWLGLVPNPFTGKIERDMTQAKIAIDTVRFLAGQLEAHLGEADRREVHNLVSNLQVNYVQQLQKDAPSGQG